MNLHHDDLVLNDRDLRLMRAYLKWVDTARKHNPVHYPATWTPTDADIAKSRLFWWIRSGHEPLPYPPPTAFSCPWYELITEPGNHGAYELYALHVDGKRFANVAACLYEIISEQEGKYTLGFGPYRFRAFRDPEAYAGEVQAANRHDPGAHQRMLDNMQDDPTKGWFLCRIDDTEIGESIT